MQRRIEQLITPMTANIERRFSTFMNKALRLRMAATISHLPVGQILEWPPLACAVVGAVAFGLWWTSISAGVFMACGLLFLAGIYTVARQGAITLRDVSRALSANRNVAAPGIGGAGDLDNEIHVNAIQRLQPWIADQSSLSEESAKVYCSILLSMLAAVRPELVGRQAEPAISARSRATRFGA